MGLLPQIAAVALVVADAHYGVGETLALAYGALILSFLGGIWWGFAMRRGERQAGLALVAVVPSLVALGIVIAGVLTSSTVALTLLATALVLTLAIDRHLVVAGDAPAGWLLLRVPLSLGLAGLTLLAALL